MSENISIIGAGPVGCYLGSLLREQNYDVEIYEKNSEIGRPIACTGIVTKAISELVELKKEFVVNKIKQAEIITQNNSVKIPVNDIILDRYKFDNHMAELAQNKGANIHLRHRFAGLINGSIILKDIAKDNNVKKKSRHLIGCDGPLSKVASIINPDKTNQTQYYIGKQALVRGNFEKDTFKVYLGSVCPNFFGWIVPENEEFARVGVAALEKLGEVFDRFLNKIDVDNNNIVELQGGIIPIFDNKHKTNAVKDGVNIYCVGDAALYVKASTGGGLVPGMRAAKALAKSHFNKTSYENEIRKIKSELWTHLKLRKTLNNFSDDDYDRLIGYLGKPSVQKVLEKVDRDSGVKLMFNLLLREPRLLGFLNKIKL